MAAHGKMNRADGQKGHQGQIKVAITSLGVCEPVKPPLNLAEPSVKENVSMGLELLEAAGRYQPDLALLPETWPTAGRSYNANGGRCLYEDAEELGKGPIHEAVAALARKHAMYVCYGAVVRDSPGSLTPRLRNAAVVVDRMGSFVGAYFKQHPVGCEIEMGIVPGGLQRDCREGIGPIVDTDFGRLGLSICFDLNWVNDWKEMKNAGADIVAWLSAYPGGAPLQAEAARLQLPIVTSVMTYDAKVVDIAGRTRVATNRWQRLQVTDLNLSARLLHTDGNYSSIVPMQAKYGERIEVETLGEEHLIVLASRDPSLPVGALMHEYGLQDYETYIASQTALQNAEVIRVDEEDQQNSKSKRQKTDALENF